MRKSNKNLPLKAPPAGEKLHGLQFKRLIRYNSDLIGSCRPALPSEFLIQKTNHSTWDYQIKCQVQIQARGDGY